MRISKKTRTHILALNEEAKQFIEQQDYAEAKALLQQAVTVCQGTYPNALREIAHSLFRIARVCQIENNEEAIHLFFVALDIYQHCRFTHPYYIGISHLLIAQSYSLNSEEAVAHYQKALLIFQGYLPEEYRKVEGILINLGQLYREQERYEEAESHYQQALALAQKNLPEDSPDITRILCYLAQLYDVQGRYADSEPLFHLVRRRAEASAEKEVAAEQARWYIERGA